MVEYKKYNEQTVSEERSFTNVDFLMGIIAVVILFIVGIRHWDSWGQINFMEGVFALVGLIFIDPIRTRTLPGKPFKPFQFETMPRLLIILIFIILIQTIAQIPFTIDNVELALSIVFAAVAEELFFRGVIINVFLEIDETISDKKRKIIYIPIFGKTNVTFRLFGLVGITLSSIFFAYIHQNYYGDIRMMIALFFGGFTFGILYYLWDDLSANILAHFILNIIAVWQSGLLVNF